MDVKPGDYVTIKTNEYLTLYVGEVDLENGTISGNIVGYDTFEISDVIEDSDE